VDEFEDALAQLAAGNGKALRLSILLSNVQTLQEKQQIIAAWHRLAVNIMQLGRVTAAPVDMPLWFELASFFEEWIQQEGTPTVVGIESREK
jgi:hypothetical protein